MVQRCSRLFFHTFQMLIRQFARHEHAIREVSFIPDVTRSADGSCVIKAGNTHILCTACFDINTTGLHVGFGRLPGSEQPRISREKSQASFETREIENTIHQSLSVALDKDVLRKVGLFLDCDVLQSEGGVKTACVSGGFVAVALALKKWAGSALFPKHNVISPVAGISCGFVKGKLVLDLDHQEAAQADVVGDFVFSFDEQLVDMHIRAQRYSMPFEPMKEMVAMALQGVRPILEAQSRCLKTSLTVLV